MCRFDSSDVQGFCNNPAIGYVKSKLLNSGLYLNGKSEWVLEACEEHFANAKLLTSEIETKHRFTEDK